LDIRFIAELRVQHFVYAKGIAQCGSSCCPVAETRTYLFDSYYQSPD
jgi:hypothetical protein